MILILLYVFLALILWSKPHSDVSSSVFPGRFSYCCYLCCWTFYYWCMSFHHNWYITYPLYLQSTIPISGPNPIPSSGPEPIPIPGPNPLPIDWICWFGNWKRFQVFSLTGSPVLFAGINLSLRFSSSFYPFILVSHLCISSLPWIQTTLSRFFALTHH